MNSLDKTFIGGPWSGEFGWELFAWHAYVRSLSEHFDKTIIVCRENSTYLYADFADDYLICNPNTGLADSFFMHGFNAEKELKDVIQRENIQLNKNTSIFVPRRIGWPPMTHYTERFNFGTITIMPKYIIFNNDSHPVKYDYVFHARARELRKQDNWSTENWDKLLALLKEEGKSVACIGTKDESLCIDGAEDLRGIDLEQLCSILANTKCAFGPSSGPMHLASLCHCPHVVWSKDGNRLRYNENWNPHNTPILFLSAHSWHPEPEYVFEKFKEWRESD